MIIVMKPQANILMVEHVIRSFQKGGFDVLVKNGDGKVVIAAIGSGNINSVAVERLSGVKTIHEKNDLFVSTEGKGFEKMGLTQAVNT